MTSRKALRLKKWREIRERREACPRFFQKCCRTAATNRRSDRGWELAGYCLGGSLEGLIAEGTNPDYLFGKFERLETLYTGSDSDLLAWFDYELPKCMELVPPEAREAFARGIRRQVHEEGTINEVDRLIETRPFRPFRIDTVDGGSYYLDRAEAVWIPNGALVVHVVHDGFEVLIGVEEIQAVAMLADE